MTSSSRYTVTKHGNEFWICYPHQSFAPHSIYSDVIKAYAFAAKLNHIYSL